MSYNVNLQHIVFRTRHSQYGIPNDERKRQLLAFINNESKHLGCLLYRINAHLNHVHILVDVGASTSIADYVRVIKANSSRAFQGHPDFPSFVGWAAKYGSFSISRWDKDRIINYIKAQEEHHRYKSFAEELAELFGEDVIGDTWWRRDWLDEEPPQ